MSIPCHFLGTYLNIGPMSIPTTDYGHIEDEKRSYVFPACGHVYGYHKSLEGNSYRTNPYHFPFEKFSLLITIDLSR